MTILRFIHYVVGKLLSVVFCNGIMILLRFLHMVVKIGRCYNVNMFYDLLILLLQHFDNSVPLRCFFVTGIVLRYWHVISMLAKCCETVVL